MEKEGIRLAWTKQELFRDCVPHIRSRQEAVLKGKTVGREGHRGEEV